MKHYEIGIDLGTSSVIIATKEQGVIFRQPTGRRGGYAQQHRHCGGGQSPAHGRARAVRHRHRAPAARRRHPGPPHDQRTDPAFSGRSVPFAPDPPARGGLRAAAITGVVADAVVESVMAAGAKQVYLVTNRWPRRSAQGWTSARRAAAWSSTSAAAPPISPSSAWAAACAPASLPVAGNAFDSCIASISRKNSASPSAR